VTAASGVHYNETVVSFESQAKRDGFISEARKDDIFAGIPLENIDKDAEAKHLLVATTEMTEEADIADFIAALEASL
jgi:glycine dehydrogenase subunit 1